MNLSWIYWKHHRIRAGMLFMSIIAGTFSLTIGAFLSRSQSQTAVEKKLDQTGDYDLLLPDMTKEDMKFIQEYSKIDQYAYIYNGGRCHTEGNDSTLFGTIDGEKAQKLFHYEPELGGRYPDKSGEITGYKSTFQQMGVAAVVGN